MKNILIFFSALAAALSWAAYKKDPSMLAGGWKLGLNLLIKVLPILILAFGISGLMQVMVPKEVIAKWLGRESGWRGIWLGCALGAITPGGPYTSFPIVAALYQAGAGLGTLVSFMTAWSLWALARLPIEAALISPRFMALRLISSLLFPPLAGGIAHIFLARYFPAANP